ncbi:zinc finger SWIM domain-containing protein 3 [Rhinophrynus dorsalis]
MQVGSCFINYEDFNENFNSYKAETNCNYTIESSVSVQYHNQTTGDSVRQDVTYTQAKFCCSQLTRSTRKRKAQETPCPAYFFLQYDEKLDRLVVKEENANHVHTKEVEELHFSSSPPTATIKSESKRLCGKRGSPAHSDEDAIPGSSFPETQVTVKEEDSSDTDNSSSPSGDELASSDNLKGEISGAAVMSLATSMKNFLCEDVGAKATMSIGNKQDMEQLGFQTSKMSGFFEKFPESLLLHRVSSELDYILYAFLVESKERVAKVVHFSFVKHEGAKDISKMLNIFKGFNTEWQKVKVIFIDKLFAHTAVLKECFPSAQVLLSVYHMARLIERSLNGREASKVWLRKLLNDAINHTSPDKLSLLSEKLKHRMDEELYSYLTTNWFSCEMLWYMHVKKGLHSCNTYMDSLDLVTSKICSLYKEQNSMVSGIQKFVENADCFNSKGLENQSDGSLGFSKQNTKMSSRPKKRNQENTTYCRPIAPAPSLPTIVSVKLPVSKLQPRQEKPVENQKRTPVKSNTCSPAQASVNPAQASVNPAQASVNPAQASVNLAKDTANPATAIPKAVPLRPLKASDNMLLSLREHCNDLGYRLCTKEWEVVKKSTHLINVQSTFIAVQILEESHQVTADGRSCTCYFNKLYQLPCRHILSLLLSLKKPVDETMVCLDLQKKYVQPLSQLKVWIELLRYSKNEDEAKARDSKIKSLTKEISNLLLQCEVRELIVRSSTLQVMIDMWNKEEKTDRAHCLAQADARELPYQWVKKEPLDGEENSGCCELYRLDAYPTVS